MPAPLLSRFAVLPAAPRDNTNGLVGWWTFDDATAADFSGSGRKGSLQGSPSPFQILGMVGNGLQFNGTSGFVTVPVPTLGANFTVACWLKADTIPTGGANQRQVFDAPSDSVGMVLSGTTTGKYGFWDGAFFEGATVTVANIWYHLAWTHDGTNKRIYVNGVQDNSTTIGAGTISAGNANIGTGVSVTRLFQGVIDDVRLYSRALVANEVFALYSQGIAFADLYSEGELPALLAATGGGPLIYGQLLKSALLRGGRLAA